MFAFQGNLGRQSTSNSLQIPGDILKTEDSELDNDTIPDSSDAETTSSQAASRNHSLSSSGISCPRTAATPTKEIVFFLLEVYKTLPEHSTKLVKTVVVLS